MRQFRARSFGELISLCFQLSVDNFIPLFVIGALFGLPSLAIQLIPQLGLVHDPLSASLIGLAAIPVALITATIAQGASIMIVAGSFTGKPVSVGDAIGTAISRFGPLLTLSIVVGLLVGIGLLFFIFPGIVFMAWYYVAAPALIVEELGYSEAMSRSKSLTQDNRGRVQGFIVLLVLLVIAVSFGTGFAMGMVKLPAIPRILLNYVVSTAVGLLVTVGPVVYYFDVRVRHDGYGLENLASFVDVIAARGKG